MHLSNSEIEAPHRVSEQRHQRRGAPAWGGRELAGSVLKSRDPTPSEFAPDVHIGINRSSGNKAAKSRRGDKGRTSADLRKNLGDTRGGGDLRQSGVQT